MNPLTVALLSSIAVGLVLIGGSIARLTSNVPGPLRLLDRALETPRWLGVVLLIGIVGVSVGAAANARAVRIAADEAAKAEKDRQALEHAREIERQRIETEAQELVGRTDELANLIASAVSFVERDRIDEADATLGSIRPKIDILRKSSSAGVPAIAGLINVMDSAETRVRGERLKRSIAQAENAVASKRSLLDRIRGLDEADANLAALGSVRIEPELAAAREKLATHRGTLAKGVPLVGGDIALAQTLLGSRLTDRGKGLFDVSGYSGVEVYLVAQGGRVTAAYAVAQPRSTGSIIPQLLTAIARDIVGDDRFDATKSYRVGSGLATTRAQIGRQPATLGWDGTRLIEVAVGRFQP